MTGGDDSEEEFSLDEEEDTGVDDDFSLDSDGDAMDDEEDEVLEPDEEDFEVPTKKRNSTKRKPPNSSRPKSGAVSSTTVKKTAKRASPSSKNDVKNGSDAKRKKTNKEGKAVTSPVGNGTDKVLEYFRKANRPYSVINIFENLHKQVPKAALTKILDNFVSKGDLSCKVFGKTKIYCYNQDKIPVPSDSELASLDQEISELKEKVSSAKGTLSSTKAELAALTSSLTDEQLQLELTKLREKSEQLESKIKRIEDKGFEPISPQRKDKLLKAYKKYRDAWVSRKRMVTDAVDQIADGMEKKPKAIYEMCGVETDQELKCTLPPKQPM